MNHDELKARVLADPETKALYDELEPEFALMSQMLRARRSAGLTQAEVAERMGTKAPAVTRLESSLGSGKHSPSLATLQKYAQAVGCKLRIELVQETEEKSLTAVD